MAARGRGGIIVMSSLAAETGTANVALYSATKAFDLVLAEGLWYELRERGVDVVAIRPGSTRTPGWQSTQPASGELRGVMEPGDVVRDALAALGTTPSIAAGSANRAAEARFRSMARRDVIELMSGITSQLVPPGRSVDDIPVAHTPPGGYGDAFPGPILAGCSDPLVDGAPDLRGLWQVTEVYAG